MNAIYEQDFLLFSYGYRPGRGAKDAVRDLGFNLQYGKFGYIVEADIKGFFDNIDYDWLLKMLNLRIDDRAFLNLIRENGLKRGFWTPMGKILHPVTGTPQGGIVSPILANVYLHYALDLWFDCVVKLHCAGKAILVRYADDYVCAFQFQNDAHRLFRAMPKRLEKFGLEVAPDKTCILRFSCFHSGLRLRFAFLGFEFFWKQDRRGDQRVMKRTARKKLQQAKQRMKQWIKANRHLKGRAFVLALNRKLVGHYNYFGLRSNEKALSSFYIFTIRCVFKWLNRRGGKKSSFSWARYIPPLKRLGVALPRIVEKQRQYVVFA